MRSAFALAGVFVLASAAQANAQSAARWIFDRFFGNPTANCARSTVPNRSAVTGSGLRRWRMPSSSMLPTVRAGEHVLSVVPPKERTWRRGDVVVFALPRDVKVTYLKRIIGLPGDTVELRAGRLYLNGKQIVREGPLPRQAPPAGAAKETRARECVSRHDGRPFPAKAYREVLPGGRSLRILECSDGEAATDSTRAFKVPAAHYFVLGDNRDNSLDSRLPQVGFVPKDLIAGLVICVLKP